LKGEIFVIVVFLLAGNFFFLKRKKPMRCFVCKKTCEEVELYEGILEDGMVMVCKICAENEGVPIIQKPSQEQLKKADVRYTVRERMERLSGMRETTDISPDQMIVHKNLARLRVPAKKQIHEDIFDDYNWKIKIERRRKKMTISQLATATGVDYRILQAIEQGKLPENFRDIFSKLEIVLNVKLLKHHEDKVIRKTPEDERRIINEVKRKMGDEIEIDELEEEIENKPEEKAREREKREKLSKIYMGEADFSKREDLNNITLNDLVRMKKEREKREKLVQKKIEESELIGDDIELEFDED
jgi:ribosome-binding protein aMBF1 (putative translation factor)